MSATSFIRINSLKRYQARRRRERFSDLPLHERAEAERHYQRLCARWADDLPQWRRAILIGRAKDLALRPRDGNWGRQLRRRRPRAKCATPTASVNALDGTQSTTDRTVVPFASPQAPPTPSPSGPPKPTSSPTYPAPIDVLGMSTTGTDGYDTVPADSPGSRTPRLQPQSALHDGRRRQGPAAALDLAAHRRTCFVTANGTAREESGLRPG